MVDREMPLQLAGWRIPKACQECRKRKIKCNGNNPCESCLLRNTSCLYRDFVRHRKKRHQDKHEVEAEPEYNTRARSPDVSQPASFSGRRNSSVNYTFNQSVSATNMASTPRQVQLYYGSTSHFALLHVIYRDLVSSQTAQSDEPRAEVEEAGAGLDMFSFRRIFFGTPLETPDALRGSNSAGLPVMLMPYDAAKAFLGRFLSTFHCMVPFRSHETFQRHLEQLYSPTPEANIDIWSQSMLLMGLALGCLATEHYTWGDILFERVKASVASLDDVVNLPSVQLSLFMISFEVPQVEVMHAHFQMEQGRPNSSFLHVGCSARKAISAGLHKESPMENGEAGEDVEERRTTFWAVYFLETWSCFHLGRPSSMSARDVGIGPPSNSFLRVLARLCKVMTRAAEEIYGRHHNSLLQMWRIAQSITDDLRKYDADMRRALGIGLEKSPQPGPLGMQQAMLMTLYYHTLLLIYRPFLVFRVRWRKDPRLSSQQQAKPKNPTETPAWLNEACNQVLSAARRTIHFLCEAALGNELVREVRYHGYFFGSACFTLIYDLMHEGNLAPTHLPWIHATLHCLSSMRPGEPIKSSIASIQTILRKLNPSYEWIPHETRPRTLNPGVEQDMDPTSNKIFTQTNHMPEPYASDPLPVLSDFQDYSLEDDTPSASVGMGSGEEMFDFTRDMGWDLDFSTMDLEAFFSSNPTLDQPMG